MTTQTRNEAAERLRADVALRISKLNPGGGGTVTRRKGQIEWCRIHLEQTLALAEEALAAERRATLEDAKAALRQAYGPDAPPEYDRSSTVSGSLDDICDLLDGVAR